MGCKKLDILFLNTVTQAKMNRVLENPYYYLENFEMVLRWVQQRYSDLLTGSELDFIKQFPDQPQVSRALLVRMIMRKGTLFRSSKLRYDEIGSCTIAAQPLLQRGWVNDKPTLTLEQLFALLTKAELQKAFGSALPDKNARKGQQLLALNGKFTEPQSFDGWHPDAAEHVYQLLIMPLCERLRLMFFGNLRQDWSEFVLADLGVYTYETVEFSDLSRAFQTREDVDDYLHLHDCRERFHAGIAAELILDDIPAQPYQNEWLEKRRAKLLFQIAQHFEKNKDWTQALDLYGRSAYAGARLRAIRVLERSEQCQAALELARIAQEAPQDDAEKQQLQRMLPRLLRKLGHARPPKNSSASVQTLALTLPRPQQPCTVEEVARTHLDSLQAPVFYVENTLINALFGLLCWDAIFAALPGAFFHPFQRSPADLHSNDFYARRQQHFDLCLSQLESQQYRQTIERNFKAKAGIQSIFIAWNVLSDELLNLALACIPAVHLKKAFERILLDLASNRSGFPDLIQFWPHEQRYRMIEVKGPGDRLQDNQLRWIDYCAMHDMPVAVCYVRWTQATP